MNLDHLIKKSKKCISIGTKLVVWPESALPFKELQNNGTLNYIINNLLNQNDTYLLSGDITKKNNKL